ncbi:10114_t:CDS:2 [Dentiscutata heterogama]|uniref:10114_t:CDS:1 n=1 Tax=Dentiscutata heterogama TaxID=1316150 RepID=A0ACA9LY41_9GLOM|nr:10114_t:CDS:2 [Dentiscutata heterogama]
MSKKKIEDPPKLNNKEASINPSRMNNVNKIEDVDYCCIGIRTEKDKKDGKNNDEAVKEDDYINNKRMIVDEKKDENNKEKNNEPESLLERETLCRACEE